MIDSVDKDVLVVLIEERLSVEALASMIMTFDGGGINDYDKMVSEIISRDSYTFAQKKLDLDLKNRMTLPVLPSIEEPLVLEFQDLFSHLYYAFL